MDNPPATLEAAYDSKIEGNIILTRVDAAMNWVRKNSLWPMPMGLACCAIELMAVGNGRFDIARFGAEVMRFSPRQADCMIVAGTVTYKMAPVVRRIYDQMTSPKWVIAMGACASSGGMYRSYAVLQGIDQILPVDVYVSGCPPRPEALLEGFMKLQEKVEKESPRNDRGGQKNTTQPHRADRSEMPVERPGKYQRMARIPGTNGNEGGGIPQQSGYPRQERTSRHPDSD